MKRFLGLLLMLVVIGCQPTPQPTPTPIAQLTPTPTPTLTLAPTPTPAQTPTPPPTPTLTRTPPVGPVRPGSTMYLLMSTAVANGGVAFQDMDPQRIYTGEDLAFFGATIMRSLTAFQYSPDPMQASPLVPDAATDTGTHSADASVWTFTLKSGMKWQDGSPVSCADFKYGVSRTFATDVITGGPTYAIQYLDIPTDTYGNSIYPGPYKADGAQQALFDQAVACNGNTITFHLKRPVPDFNYTVTLGFEAVPNPVDHPGADTGEAYDKTPWSDGPYMIDSFSSGIGGSLVLKRNPYWDGSTDTYRGAYPDQWVVEFGIDPKILDQRLMNPTGNDQYAVAYSNVQPDNLSTIFANSHTANPAFAGRAFSDYDPYSSYYWIRTDKVPNLLTRQAMAVAVDRDAIRNVSGGQFTGDFADGVLKPNIGQDYAATHLWDTSGPFGEDVPTTGDVLLARRLIKQSGEPAPTITFDYVPSPIDSQVAGIVQDSLQRAGFTVHLVNTSIIYGYVLNPYTQDEFGGAGWGPDWPNASTVIPTLFTPDGGYDLSRVSSDNYPSFESAVQDAMATLDRQQQAQEWQALDQQASDQVFAIPTFWGLQQNLAGTLVGNLYRWGPYASWPYAQLYAKQ